MKLQDVSEVAVLEVTRDGEFSSLGLLPHRTEDMLVHVYDEKFLPLVVENSRISCVITNETLSHSVPEHLGLGIAADPQSAFYRIHEYLSSATSFYWEDFDTEVCRTAIIHDRAYVSAKNVRIGGGTVIEPNVSILERTIIGSDVRIRAGSVIGGEGFEAKWVQGQHVVIRHAGGIRIGDRVEIQGNGHIARSLFGGFTEIGEDTKVDALVHIAHNVSIGRGCEIAARAMLAGSASIGDNVWIGPSASVSSWVRIGDGAKITIGAVVTKDVGPGEKVSGNFAIEHSRFIENLRKIR